MPKITIYRGLPGSGKSTLAREQAKETGAILIEPDSMMIIDGNYRYTPERFKKAVECCEEIIRMAAQCFADVIYADVLPTAREAADLVNVYCCALPEQTNIEVKVRSCKISADESKERNQHNVKPEDIDRMAALWQECPIKSWEG